MLIRLLGLLELLTIRPVKRERERREREMVDICKHSVLYARTELLYARTELLYARIGLPGLAATVMVGRCALLRAKTRSHMSFRCRGKEAQEYKKRQTGMQLRLGESQIRQSACQTIELSDYRDCEIVRMRV
jgi:hypothetical protein